MNSVMMILAPETFGSSYQKKFFDTVQQTDKTKGMH